MYHWSFWAHACAETGDSLEQWDMSFLAPSHPAWFCHHRLHIALSYCGICSSVPGMVCLGGISRASGVVCIYIIGLGILWLLIQFPVCALGLSKAWHMSERSMRQGRGPTIPWEGLLLVTSLPLHRPHLSKVFQLPEAPQVGINTRAFRKHLSKP